MPLIDLRRAGAESRMFRTREVGALRPVRWLRLGWRDLLACPAPGLVHGAATAAFGALLLAFAWDRFWLLSGAFSGFLIVAPIVATGLYRVSRGLEQGRLTTLRESLAVWAPRDGRLVVFGLLLGFAGTGWVLTSASLITGFAGVPVTQPIEFLHRVVLDDTSYLFEAWLALGGMLAAPVFASSVVALPLLLDTRSGVLGAVLTSWRVVLDNPMPLALWAGMLLALTLLSMALALLPLVVVVPWLAHASWHAYRDLVGSEADSRQG
ncbi:MAG: hypothetical protein RI988_2907 [Pseudomonadota bacterium]|jgi:uncharacterized membrane protein